MTAFSQCGDPVCPACLCQHHGAAYAENTPTGGYEDLTLQYDTIGNGVTIAQVPITITERCCVIVNAATITASWLGPSAWEVERPLNTIRTTQRDMVVVENVILTHHAAWEVLPPGIYTYFLVNRSGGAERIYGAWIKAVASDCEG